MTLFKGRKNLLKVDIIWNRLYSAYSSDIFSILRLEGKELILVIWLQVIRKNISVKIVTSLVFY